MDKEFYDKYSKDLECNCCQDLEHCINGKEPLKINCAIHFFKDKIAELETKFADADDCAGRYWKQLIVVESENCELKQQLAEKDELLKQKIGNMQSIDFIRMCVSCGFMVQAKQNDNQTAIAELEKVRACFGDYLKGLLWNDTMLAGKVCNMINEIFDQQIKELKGENTND